MKLWQTAVTTAIVAAAIIGLLLASACSGPSAVKRQADGGSSATELALDNFEAMLPPEGIATYPSGWPPISARRAGVENAPELDLQAVLRSSRGGGEGQWAFEDDLGRLPADQTSLNGYGEEFLKRIRREAQSEALTNGYEARLLDDAEARAALNAGDLDGVFFIKDANGNQIEVSGYTQFRYALKQQHQAIKQQMTSIPGALPSIEDEIWIIQKPANWDTAQRASDVPGSGSLLCSFEPGTPTDQLIPVPLAHTDVRAHIGGLISSTVVTQRFENPYDAKIEAVYVFPLPQNAAVNDFLMTVGERRIRGIIRDKDEAEQLYAEARAAGHVASLLTQERPNVFTQKVANIEPGKAIDVSITYFHTLAYRDGSFEYVFPMVVGPRFNPPPSESFAAGSGVGAAPRGANGASGQQTEVQYLAPNERSGLDVALEIEIDAGVPLGEILCKSHTTAVRRDGETGATIRLASQTTIPNKDFVLRFSLANQATESGMITWVDPESGDGYFAMLVAPPPELASLPRRPMELVFVVDASGSMNGVPIEQAKSAVRQGLRMLEPGDTFQLINFSNTSSQLGPSPLAATPDSTREAERYLNKLVGAGGTMMINGIRASLDFPRDGDRARFVCFLTDGFIGNETEILGEMRARLNGAHVFGFGVGSSPNRYLIERMAHLGRGAVAYLSLEDDGGEVMSNFFEHAAHPALTDLAIDWPAIESAEVYPSALPDLYVGRPVMITGRFDPAKADAPVRLTGVAGRLDYTIDVARTEIRDPALARGIRAVWARSKIAGLMDEATYEPNPTLAADVKSIALENSLMSAFTAFIAVDSSAVTEGSFGTTVAVPVSVPEGVKYETTVPGGR